MRARANAKIKNKKKILQIDIFCKFYSNIAYLVWGLFNINSVWKTFAFLTFRWQKNNQDFCVYTCLLGHSWICVQSVRLSACKDATISNVSIFEKPLISPSLWVNQEGREGRVCHFDYSFCQIAVQSQRIFLWASSAKSMLWLIIITLLAELGGSDWLVKSFMGGEGEYLLLGLGCLGTQYRHLIWNPHTCME